MIDQIKEFVKENPGMVAGGAALSLIMALNFGGDVADVDQANNREPASISRKAKKPRKTIFSDLAPKRKERLKFKKTKIVKKKVKKKEESNPTAGKGDTGSASFGFGGSSSGGSLDFNYSSGSSDYVPEYVEDSSSSGDDSTYEAPDTTEASTVGTTSTGGTTGVSGGGGGGAAPVTPVCSASPGNGIYISNPEATITCSNAEDIYYCVTKDGSCCDPTDSGSAQLYNSEDLALVSSKTAGELDNGSFCLSFYAVSSTDTPSSVTEVNYSVDGDAIDISIDSTPLLRQMKSTEVHQMLPYVSDSFGLDDYDFFAINIGDTAPAGGQFPSDCAGLVDSYGDLDDPFILRGPASYITPTHTYGLSDILDVELLYDGVGDHALSFGENNIVGFMRFTDSASENKYGCISTPITVMDSNSHGPLLNKDIKSHPEFQGGIKSYGHFDHTASSGSGKAQVGDYILESGYINITH